MNEKHFCDCGCGKEIIIKPWHLLRGKKSRGIPHYIRGHNIGLLHKKGKEHPQYNKPRSNEWKKAHSKTMRGRPSSRRGVKLSEETKQKQSISHMGISTWNKGKKGKNSHLYGSKSYLYGKPPHHGKHIKYKEIYFRSSWESSFAEFLDGIQEPYKYESKTFELEDKTYTPDFYLPDRNLWVEIKGYWRDDAKEKFLGFLQKYPKEKILLIMHTPPYTKKDLNGDII